MMVPSHNTTIVSRALSATRSLPNILPRWEVHVSRLLGRIVRETAKHATETEKVEIVAALRKVAQAIEEKEGKCNG